MRLEDIKSHARRQPFQPVRIYVSDQASYDVFHPELILLGKSEVTIGLPADDSDVYERLVHIDPLHITRIERLPPKKRAGRPRP